MKWQNVSCRVRVAVRSDGGQPPYGIYAAPTEEGGRRRWWRDGVGHPSLTRAFHWTLGQGLRMPVATIAVALLLPLTGFVLAPSLGNSFFPPALIGRQNAAHRPVRSAPPPSKVK